MPPTEDWAEYIEHLALDALAWKLAKVLAEDLRRAYGLEGPEAEPVIDLTEPAAVYEERDHPVFGRAVVRVRA